jgi:hypothetical protein
VPVEVVIERGDLASPEPDFNIEFSTVSSLKIRDSIQIE